MIKFSIQDGAKMVSLETDSTTDEHVSIALRGAFGIFGLEEQQEVKIPMPEIKTGDPVKAITALREKQAREVAAAKSEVVEKPILVSEPAPVPAQAPPVHVPVSVDYAPSRPRAVALLGSNRSLQVPIGEAAALPDQPEWYATGIKIKDGVPHYRTRYWCQNSKCNHQGNQYVPLEASETECHNCHTLMKIRPATGFVGDDGVPQRDRFGNYFRADKLAEGQTI